MSEKPEYTPVRIDCPQCGNPIAFVTSGWVRSGREATEDTPEIVNDWRRPTPEDFKQQRCVGCSGVEPKFQWTDLLAVPTEGFREYDALEVTDLEE
jgi:hypothetical protein